MKWILCLTLLIGMLGPNAFGAAKKTLPPSRHGKVIAVDVAAKTISFEAAPGAPPQKCLLSEQTTVEINDRTATLKKVTPGLYIRSVRLDSSTPPVVLDLDLTSKG